MNVGEGESRNWADCRRYGFLAAGGHPKWSGPIRGLEEGDVVVAYLKGAGYVGVGVVRSPAVPYAMYQSSGRALAERELVEPNVGHDSGDFALCEYILAVDWMAAVDRENAKWLPKSGLFTSQLVRASLDAQPATIAFVEEAFAVDLAALADGRDA